MAYHAIVLHLDNFFQGDLYASNATRAKQALNQCACSHKGSVYAKYRESNQIHHWAH